jgi:hypothetical protein
MQREQQTVIVRRDANQMRAQQRAAFGASRTW